MRVVATALSRSACIGVRIEISSRPARTKLPASATKAALRPNTTVKPAPRAAPTASIAPHVADIMAVATGRSSSSTRLATPAWDAGPKKAPRAVTPPWATKTIHGRPAPASRKVRATAAWANETTTRIFLRSKRSATGPAMGAMTKVGRLWATQNSDASRSEPVASSRRPIAATVANQSPA